jgi:hypothetical protein
VRNGSIDFTVPSLLSFATTMSPPIFLLRHWRRGRQWRVKEHELLLDGSPASGGEIHLPGLAVGWVDSVRTARPEPIFNPETNSILYCCQWLLRSPLRAANCRYFDWSYEVKLQAAPLR